MNKIALFFLLLLSISGIETSVLIGQTSGTDNPIMVIRCRFQREGLTTNEDKNVSKRIDDTCPMRGGSGILEIPNPDASSPDACIPRCFNGEVMMDFAPLDCSNVADGDVIETQVCFTSADENNPLSVGQFVTFEDISNCLDPNGLEWIEQLASYNTAIEQPGFANAAEEIDGVVKVCATFYIEPSEGDVMASILDANGNTISEISEDPCVAGAAAAIPTLNQWGLLILSLITCCLALGFMLKRKPLAE